MNDNIFRILILVLLVIVFAISGYYRRKAQRTGGDKIDWTQEGAVLMLILRITGFGMWLSFLAYVINPESLAFAALPFPDAVRWFGFSLSVVAIPLVFWMFRSLGNNITDTVQTRESAQLVVQGPYRWIRHPLYTFGGMFAVGLMLMTANGLIIALGAIAFTMLVLRTPNEEQRLVDKFGDSYRDYMTRTGRFLPRLSQ